MPPRTLRDTPLPPSPFGQGMYQAGRALVTEHGLRLPHIMWDADEVLWDWVMDATRAWPPTLAQVTLRDMGHREYIRPKAGLWELLWGMHHASLELGLDPHMRIWTNGYTWRIREVGRHIPGFDQLMGAQDSSLEGYRALPNLFARGDFATAARHILPAKDRAALLEHAPQEARDTILRELRQAPFNSNLKIPDLAPLARKEGFSEVYILVDDRRDNIERFVHSGRCGVHCLNWSSRILLGAVPNTCWRDPLAALEQGAGSATADIADALRAFAQDRSPRRLEARATLRPQEPYPKQEFWIEVPDARIRSGWIEPMRSLKRDFKQESRRKKRPLRGRSASKRASDPRGPSPS